MADYDPNALDPIANYYCIPTSTPNADAAHGPTCNERRPQPTPTPTPPSCRLLSQRATPTPTHPNQIEKDNTQGHTPPGRGGERGQPRRASSRVFIVQGQNRTGTEPSTEALKPKGRSRQRDTQGDPPNARPQLPTNPTSTAVSGATWDGAPKRGTRLINIY